MATYRKRSMSKSVLYNLGEACHLTFLLNLEVNDRCCLARRQRGSSSFDLQRSGFWQQRGTSQRCSVGLRHASAICADLRPELLLAAVSHGSNAQLCVCVCCCVTYNRASVVFKKKKVGKTSYEELKKVKLNEISVRGKETTNKLRGEGPCVCFHRVNRASFPHK